MKRVKWIVSAILILALVALTLGGCLPESSGTKAVGGGWIASASEVSGEKATFGFSAKLVSMEPIEDYVYKSKGTFRLVDHGTDQKFRARIKGTYLTATQETRRYLSAKLPKVSTSPFGSSIKTAMAPFRKATRLP